RDDVATCLAERGEGLPVRLPRRHLGADLVARQFELARPELVWRLRRVRLRDLDAEVADAAELRDRLVRMVERLAVPAVLVFDLLDALALDRARHDRGRLAGAERLLVRAVDRLDVVAVDLDRMPPEGPCAVRVRVEVPPVHRLAPLPETVDVDDGDEVVEPVERRVLEGLPLRALCDLAVAAQNPDPHRELIELLARERHPDAVREA